MNTHGADFWAQPLAPHIAPEQFTKIVTTAADLAIFVTTDGIVQSVIVNPLNATLGRLDHWVNRDIRDFTIADSLPKLERCFAAYRTGGNHPTDAIEINHCGDADWEFPIRYTLHETGRDGVILMLGRDLRPVAELQQRLVKAQLTLDKDYETSRDYEIRYRVVMDTAPDGFIVVEVASGRIIDANAAAARILETAPDALVGTSLSAEFEGRKRGAFIDDLVRAANDEILGPVRVTTRRGHNDVALYPTVFRVARYKTLLCRIDTAEAVETAASGMIRKLDALFREGPDAVVFTDGFGIIRSVNDAFLSLCGAGDASYIRGKSLSDFLVRGSVDLKTMMDHAARAGFMRIHATRLKDVHGAMTPVECSATALGSIQSTFAFVMRDATYAAALREIPATEATEAGATAPITDDAMRNVIELVGATSLKDIVAATTDVVEKMCIETAVTLTGNNRVAAAEMLGLSRQSLYVKLRKYGLLDKNQE